MLKLRSKSKSSSSADRLEFLDLCKHNVRSIEDLASGRKLLNKRQCVDLSTKLSKTNLNIRELVDNCGASAYLFRPALEDLYRYLEKAKALVSKCAEEDWCKAAVFQMHNENAFREILLDISLCYNAIYELAKSTSEDLNALPEDLRESPVFRLATDDDVHKDHLDLEKRLGDFAKEPRSVKLWDRFLPDKVALKQCLARHLLVRLRYTSNQSQATTLDSCSEILWTKESEPAGTWGFYSSFLGAGSGASGVCSTKWMGIPCAKKTFHPQESESFFLKEAGILAHLNHPCIVNFFCCGNGQERGDRFIAMELMEKSFFHLIQDQKGAYFALAVVVDIIVQIARGMCYLHDRGVAHRDLKPQNVVVNRLTCPHLEDHFYVKLVDFGMSRTKVQGSKSNTISFRGVGTIMYRAPEVHPKANPNGKGKVKWFKADVFSFAMTCAHLLSLKAPLEDKRRSSEVYNELKSGWRPELPEGCPQELVALITDCWNINPVSRPRFKEVCVRLERFRHKFVRGFSTLLQVLQEDKIDFSAGFEFIKTELEVQSSIQRPLVDYSEDGAEDEFNKNDVVSTITCDCGHVMELIPQPPIYDSGVCTCNMCWENMEFGAVYHCKTCQFDAHRGCAEITDEVEVFFHDHPLQLLVQKYYSDNSDAICYFCQESLQGSEWVYRCEQCDFDTHALCTKYPKKRMWKYLHPHLLTLIQCPPRKSLLCTCCNCDIRGNTWRYTCTEKWCSCDVHPYCAAILFGRNICIFDNSHKLELVSSQKGFHCSRCGEPGFSWFYHCDKCDVDIHLDCMGYTEEVEDYWFQVYEKLMLECGSKEDYIKMDMILEQLDRLFISKPLEADSSSSSRSPPEGPMRVRPTIQRLTSSEAIIPSVDASHDVNLRKKIGAQTIERKAKKMAAKEAWSKSKEKLPEMLENLEKIVLDLQSAENVSQAYVVVLAATHEKLKKRQYIEEEEKALQMQSKIRQGPRICLFYQRSRSTWTRTKKLLTSLRADMMNVCLSFLCEEPGHRHVMDLFPNRMFPDVLGEERLAALQPLLASGLQVVTSSMSTLAGHRTDQLGCVSLPNFGSDPWDLRTIDLEKHGMLSKDKENVEELKRSEDSAAEWNLRDHELYRESIYKYRGLLRVRYLVTEVGNYPRYTRGTLAWLCREHLNRGLESGILESYPVKYYNEELN